LSKVTLQIVVSLIDAARGVIYDHHMFIVQATGVDPIHLLVEVVAVHAGHEVLVEVVSDTVLILVNP
jgi:hypothetical protein